jgi:hypothetical protein
MDETQGLPWARLVPFAERTISICNPSLCGGDSNGVQTTAPFQIRPERGRFASVELRYGGGSLETSIGAFAAAVDRWLMLWDLNIFDERPQIVNAAGPKRTVGARLVTVYRHAPVTLELQYDYTRSTIAFRSRTDRITSPLTPRHAAGLRGSWEAAALRTTFDTELEYTGHQHVVENPYRAVTPSYWTFSVGASRRFAGITLYIGAENLGDVRQTHFDSLLQPAQEPSGRLITDVWAPLTGRTIRIGLRTRGHE